jgi:hypothetical protein
VRTSNNTNNEENNIRKTPEFDVVLRVTVALILN